MKRDSVMMRDAARPGMVSPLVDVIFNLMITMFVFLMIYMAVAQPSKKAAPLKFLRKEMPIAKTYSDYASNIAVANGSGRFTFIVTAPGGDRAVVIFPRRINGFTPIGLKR